MGAHCNRTGPQTERKISRRKKAVCAHHSFKRKAKRLGKSLALSSNNDRRNHLVTVFIKLFSIILIRINLNTWNIRG